MTNRAAFTLGIIGSLALMAAAFAVWTPARADATCYVGATASAQIAQASSAGITVAENGTGLGAMVGCGIGVGGLDLGGRVGYDWGINSFADGSWHAAGVAGWRLNDYVRPYALAGFAGVDGGYHFRGLMAGAGLDIRLSKGVSLVTEYNRVWLDAKTIDDIKVKPGAHVIRVGVKADLF